MPKVVDRDERKRAIVEAAWRIIATHGVEAVNMRDLASEAGYANGALARYFQSKDEVLELAYEHVLAATTRRIDTATRDRRGIEAVEAMCAEIMPLTAEARLEGRIALALWQRALNKPSMRRLNDDAVALWTERLSGYLADIVHANGFAAFDPELHAELLMTTMIGLQVSADFVFAPSPGRQREMLHAVLAPLRSA